MTAELNELFEEGITRSRELTDAADEALAAIDDMATEAGELTQRVQDEGRQACQHMRELVSRLEQAEGDLESAGGQAEGALEGLAAKAEDLETEMGHLLERVRKSLDHLESRQQELDDSLDAQLASTEQGFQELARKTHEAQTQADQQLQAAAQVIAAFRGAVEGARAEFTQQQESWSDAVGTLQTAAHEHAAAWRDGLQGLLSRQARTIVEATNAMVGHHNKAMEGLRRRFVQQAPQDLATALEPLRAALEHLGEEAAERERRLSAEAQELEHSASQSLPILRPIESVLGRAAELA